MVSDGATLGIIIGCLAIPIVVGLWLLKRSTARSGRSHRWHTARQPGIELRRPPNTQAQSESGLTTASHEAQASTIQHPVPAAASADARTIRSPPGGSRGERANRGRRQHGPPREPRDRHVHQPNIAVPAQAHARPH